MGVGVGPLGCSPLLRGPVLPAPCSEDLTQGPCLSLRCRPQAQAGVAAGRAFGTGFREQEADLAHRLATGALASAAMSLRTLNARSRDPPKLSR